MKGFGRLWDKRYRLRIESGAPGPREIVSLWKSEFISRGVIDVRDLVFFASLIGCFLFANAIVVELKKAD